MVIPQKVRGPKRFYWDLVLNNYTLEDCEVVNMVFEEIADAYICSKEIGSENGTPHLQMAIKLKKGNYKSYILSKFKNTCIGNRISIREIRNLDAAIKYCSGLDSKENSDLWISKNVSLMKDAKKQFKEWERHNTLHKTLYKDKGINIKELMSNWDYYDKLAKELNNEKKRCNYCKQEQIDSDTESTTSDIDL